nr:MAG: ORF1 [TTV-like mini virus]
MPWRRWGFYRRRYRRNYWFRRPRKTFRTRRWRRRRYWVRKFKLPKRKLKRLRLLEYQPKSIRKCNVKGMLCLFQTVESRISCNFDMYEESIVPDRLPGGGGFSIKVLSLYSLYQENIHGHNIWTFPNTNYPLVRYTGCSIKLYQSLDTDYVVTYNNTWPMHSSLLMYNTMQPSLHTMQKNKIIVPSKNTIKRRKPYIKTFIPPPTQMQNKWYFQKDLAQKPLFMIRTSCLSLDRYYIGSRSTSTNINIHSLNPVVFQNRNWGIASPPYWCTIHGTQHLYLYVTKEHTAIEQTECSKIILLGNTKHNTPGYTYAQIYGTTEGKQNEYMTKNYMGNPFYGEYLHNDETVYLSAMTPQEWIKAIGEKKKPSQLTPQPSFTNLPLSITVRYNPYTDNGSGNQTYFLPVKVPQQGWNAPTDTKLTNENLPLWIQQFGFPDFQKKQNIIHNIDTDHILVINTKHTTPTKVPLIPISPSFYEGHSPYEQAPNQIDYDSWYPCYQYQQEANNDICISGPGTPKIPPGNTVEAKIKYSFHFKWGGDLPPMSTIADPTDQPWYPVPNNFQPPNSLQDPTTRPETYLYAFDERRGDLTKKAISRITKDFETKELSFLPTEPRFGEKTETQDTQEETTSEEEKEEDLFQLLQQQRLKQLQLRQRILKTLHKLQNLE